MTCFKITRSGASASIICLSNSKISFYFVDLYCLYLRCLILPITDTVTNSTSLEFGLKTSFFCADGACQPEPMYVRTGSTLCLTYGKSNLLFTAIIFCLFLEL